MGYETPVFTFYDCLFIFCLLSRVSDILTTWLVTPTLKLEANPVARRLRWPFAFLTLLVAFLAYYWPEIAVVTTTASFMVAGSNATGIPMARAMGEEALYKFMLENIAKGGFWPGLLWRIAPAPFYGLLCLFMFMFYPTPNQWGYWITVGVGVYLLAILVHRPIAYLRFWKIAHSQPSTA